MAELVQTLKRLPLVAPVLADVHRLVGHGRAHCRIVRDDLRKTRRQMRWLRDALPPATGPTVLILAGDDSSIYALKQLGMLAAGLRLRGWRPVAVFSTRLQILGERYLRCFGVDLVVRVEDQPLPGDVDIAAACAPILERADSIGGLRDCWFRSCWIGPQLIATLSRLTFRGGGELTSPEAQERLRWLVPKMVRRVLQAEALIRRVRPRSAVVIEANYYANGPIVDAAIAGGVDVLQTIQPWRDDAMIFRRLDATTRREHPGAIARANLDRLAAQPWTATDQAALDALFADRYSGRFFLQARNTRGTRERGRDELITDFRLDPDKPVVCVFSHVLWDANLFYGEDLFADYGDWFVQTIAAAVANPRVNWLIKLHPANAWKLARESVTGPSAEEVLIAKEIGELPGHVTLLPADCDVSTGSLFGVIDACVTVRGTVGLEFPVFGTPVYTAGTGRYSGLGITIDSDSRSQYLQRMACIESTQPLSEGEVLRARRHALAVLRDRLWYMRSFRASFAYRDRGSHPLDHDLHPEVTNIAEVHRNGDLAAWADWAEAGGAIDYFDVDCAPELAADFRR